MGILDNEVLVNDYNFTEKKTYGSAIGVEITNSSARTVEYGETVVFDGWIGNVLETDGIEAGDSGLIDVNERREISMNQVDTADSFTAGPATIFFVPQTDSIAGYWTDTTATGSYSVNVQIIGAAPAATTPYIEYKPPVQDGALSAEA